MDREFELELIRPKILVCLGATAAQALLGKDFRVTERRGQLLESELDPYVTATVHPSSILRARGAEGRHQALQRCLLERCVRAVRCRT